jgi:hypothetical protein
MARLLCLCLCACAACGPGGSTVPVPNPNATSRGTVSITELQFTGLDGKPNTSTSATAQFVEDKPNPNACTVAAIGPCLVKTCPTPIDLQTVTDAGAITIGGGAAPIVLSYSAASYGLYSDGNVDFAAGAGVTVAAAGGHVPKFDASFSMGGPLTVSAPAPSVASLSAAGFDVAWGALGGGELILTLTPTGAGNPASAVCHFPGGDAHGSVPADALAPLPRGPISVEAASARGQHVTAGTFDVLVSGGFGALTPAGTVYSFSTTLQ